RSDVSPGTEGLDQVHRIPASFPIAHPAGKVALHVGKLLRIGALKAIDRLLPIAHGEDRARRTEATGFGGAFAGKELFRDSAHNLPLLRIRVLCLVDQAVVDPSIELVEHPG